MPNRILREGILTSPKLAKLGWAEEVMYRRLMSLVDDFGRYFADPSVLRGHLYPRQINKVSDSDVGKWLQGIEAAGLVRVYPAEDGERYLELLKFGQQVRAKKSRFPDPPASDSACNHLLADEHLDVSVFESVSDKPPHPPAGGDVGFEKFWNAWPPHDRKVARKQCRDKWRIRDCEPITDRIVAHVEAMKRSEAWLKDKGQFIPAPLVYLNQSRWEGSTADEQLGDWHETRLGVEKKAAALGIPPWDETVQYGVYRQRVIAAAGAQA